jgi:hypothetical protein
MELPILPKRASVRPRPPEHLALASDMRSRYSRALGVFALLRDRLAECDLAEEPLAAGYKPDCIGEIVDAMACDEHREWFEREFEVRYRFTTGSEPLLHAARPPDIRKLEERLVRDFSRRQAEHAYPFAIGGIRLAWSHCSHRQLKGGGSEPGIIHGISDSSTS